MSKIIMKLTALLLGLAGALTLQAQEVKGIVTDSKGEPLMGVFVMIEGTTTGTSTGLDGDYVIDVPNASKAVLQFSLIGMKTVSIPVAGKSVIDVVLEDEATTLDDVVVVGYATVKRRDLLGSVSSRIHHTGQLPSLHRRRIPCRIHQRHLLFRDPKHRRPEGRVLHGDLR